MTPELDPELISRQVGLRLYQEDLDAIAYVQEYLRMQPWFPGQSSVSTAIRFALRNCVVNLIAEVKASKPKLRKRAQ